MEKRFLGMPMRWEPSPRKITRNYWNAENGRIMSPKVGSVGWDTDFHTLFRRLGAIRGVGR
jgi:hypothetical protein